jgi:hypothetical protein
MMNSRSWNGAGCASLIVVDLQGGGSEMKTTVIALSAAVLMVGAPAAFAMGASSHTPGHEMHMKGKKHHGASSFAPGHEMQAKGSVKGHPGASGYAPGQTTGMSKQKY